MNIIFRGNRWFRDYLLHRFQFISPDETGKMVFTLSRLGAHHDKGSVGNKLATSIGIAWERYLTLYLMPPYSQ